MDEIASLYTKKNGKFACNTCNIEMNRYDNIKRHIEEKHLKIKVTCECGKTMTKSAMSRHKRSTCSVHCKQSDTIPTAIVSVEDYIVDSFKVQLIKSSDGSVSIAHDAIQVDGHLFNLVPINTSKINLSKDVQTFY